MAFKKIGTLIPYGAPVLRKEIITNSVVSTVMDSVKMVSGFVALGTSTALVFGHLMNHKSKTGNGLNSTGVAGAEMGSYVNTYTAAANNQTVALITAECDVSKHSMYTASLSAALGTTANSNLGHFNFNITDQATLTESSVTTASAQYHSWGIDPTIPTQLIVNIYSSQVFGV